MKPLMNLRSKPIYFMLAASLLAPTLALAGDGKGNGGVSVVCRDSRQRVITAEVLDLWEAKNDPTLNISVVENPGSNEKAEFDRIVKKLGTTKLGFDLVYFNQANRKSVKPLTNPGVGIPLPTDFHPRVQPTRCKIEAAAKYLPDGQIQLDMAIYDAMNATHKAALWVHEALYKAARLNVGAVDSDATRIAVAHLYSNENPTDYGLTENVIIANQGNSYVIRSTVATGSVLNFSVVDSGRVGEFNALYRFSVQDGSPDLGLPFTAETTSSLMSFVHGRPHCAVSAQGCSTTILIRKLFCHLKNQEIRMSYRDMPNSSPLEATFDFNRILERTVKIEVRDLSVN